MWYLAPGSKSSLALGTGGAIPWCLHLWREIQSQKHNYLVQIKEFPKSMISHNLFKGWNFTSVPTTFCCTVLEWFLLWTQTISTGPSNSQTAEKQLCSKPGSARNWYPSLWRNHHSSSSIIRDFLLNPSRILPALTYNACDPLNVSADNSCQD